MLDKIVKDFMAKGYQYLDQSMEVQDTWKHGGHKRLIEKQKNDQKIPSKLMKENFNNILQKGHKNCTKVLVTKVTKFRTWKAKYREKKVKWSSSVYYPLYPIL